MTTLSNDKLSIQIAAHGAELQSIFQLEQKLEYLWQGLAAYWPKRSPILFPIVGQVKDGTYHYNGKDYKLSRHGFARDNDFLVEHANENKATFLLKSNTQTLEIYPFVFELRVHYELNDNTLIVTYDVYNPSSEIMYFSVGGHPAFRVPLVNDTVYNDYYLEFEQTEEAPRYTLQDGLIAGAQPFLQYEKKVQLHHELFYNDAVILKHLKSESVYLKSDKTVRGLHFKFGEFPYLGIWAAKDAPFVCIEPWQGITDNETHNQDLTQKEGIVALGGQQRHQQSWSVTLF